MDGQLNPLKIPELVTARRRTTLPLGEIFRGFFFKLDKISRRAEIGQVK